MSENPYAPPKSSAAKARDDGWPVSFLLPMLASLIAVPLGLALMGVFRRAPDLFARADFLIPLFAGAFVAGTVLHNYRSAVWFERVVFAPPICFAVYFGVLVIWRWAAA